MKISVVIPTFNRAHTITNSLHSVAYQTAPPDEIILVDDGSTDNTSDMVRNLGLPNLKYIYQKNSGANAARNNGIAIAKNPWIAFHDSDDCWLPNKLAVFQEEFNSRPVDDQHEIQVIFSAFNLFDPEKRRVRLMPSHLSSVTEKSVVYKNPLVEMHTLLANPISTQTLIVRKELLVEVGNFDVRLRRFQDWDLAIRLAAVSRILYIPEPLCYVTLSSDSLTRNYSAGLDARRVLLKKHSKLYKRFPKFLAKAELDLLARHVLGVCLGRSMN